MVRRVDIFEDHGGDLPEGLPKLLEEKSGGDDRDNEDRDTLSRPKKFRRLFLVGESAAPPSPESRLASSDKRLGSSTKTTLHAKEQRRVLVRLHEYVTSSVIFV